MKCVESHIMQYAFLCFKIKTMTSLNMTLSESFDNLGQDIRKYRKVLNSLV